MKSLRRFAALLALVPGAITAAPAFQFDFNGMNVAVLRDQVDDSPNSTGVWIGKSSVPEVVSGSLTAPSGLNYALSPGLSDGRFFATRTDNAFRGQFHRVVPASGVMWISALVQAVDESAAAVVIDGGDTNNAEGWTLQNKGGFGIRPDATAGTTELFWSDNLIDLTSNQSVTLPVDYSGQTVLILARIDFSGAGSNVDVWVNPVLTSAAALGTTGDLEAATTYTSMEWCGMGAVDNGLTGYTVEFDNVVCSNDAFEEAAFAAVTGLPAPPPPPPPPGIVGLFFDFNNMSLGNLRDQSDDSPNAAGVWQGNTGVPKIIAGDLMAPASTNYAVPSAGVAGSVSAVRADSEYRGQYMEIAPPGKGVMWFSALVEASSSTAAAVVIDGHPTDLTLAGKAGVGVRPDASGGSTELFWSEDLADTNSNQSATLPVDYSSQTVLLVGRIDFSGAGNNVDVWLNPVLSDRAALGTIGDLEAATARTRMEWVGLGVADDGSAGYNASFDNILFSNDPDEDVAFRHVTGVLPAPYFGAADVNGNGLSDLSELMFPGLSDLPGSEDSDGDGRTNEQEALARTDPFDPSSRFEATGMQPGVAVADTVEFSFASVEGVRYRMRASDDLDNWINVGGAIVAVGPETTVVIPIADLPSADRSFIRAEVLAAIDSDADGLEDALEEYLGFDTTVASSVRSTGSGGDLQQFFSLMAGGNARGGMFGTTSAGVPSPEQASRFLAQASFGPTLDKISALRSLGPNAYEKWIDQQLAENPNFLRTYIDLLVSRMSSDAAASPPSGINPTFPHFVTSQTSFAMFRENVNTVWMRQALFADDELRQRVAWALSQIVVIGPRCNSYGIAAADWYDTVLRHSLGNYRDLLYDISVHPWMGWWLSHLGNRKADPTINRLPDENFAREIMQLFSIGLVQLNMDGTPVLDLNGDPIETYTNDDITQLARVFTGLDLQTGVGGQGAFAVAPMRMIEDRHDTGDAVSQGVYDTTLTVVPGEKAFLGQTLPPFSADPGRTGLDDISDAVDILINHPNCPPFISKNLIQHLVKSNPSPAYVERVANVFADDGTGTRGNLAATVKAILLDPEARELSAALDPTAGRLKGPMLRTTSMARAFDAGAATPALHDLTGIQFWSPRKQTVFAEFLEYPFESPSVFNFYEPGFSRPGEVRDLGLLSPEFQIMNALTATTLPNRLWWFVENGLHNGNPAVTPDFELELEVMRTMSTDTDVLLDRLNLLLCHGSLSPDGRAELKAAIDFYAATDPNWLDRCELAVYLALISPDGAVLK